LDRIDLHVQINAVPLEKLSDVQPGEKSEIIRERVEKARKLQRMRFAGTNLHANGQMNSQQVRKFCLLDEESNNLLKKAADQLHLTARAYFRVIKVARTIADLAGDEEIKSRHIAEALQYRSLMHI